MKRLLFSLLFIAGLIACEEPAKDVPESKETTTDKSDPELNTGNKPVAPFPAIPDNLPNRPVYKRMERDFVIPTAKQVGIPGYPGAYAITGKSKMDLETKIILPTVILVSADEPSTVIDYYKKALKDWNFDETQSIFWQGEGEYFPNDQRPDIESVYVQPSSQPLAEILVPDAKTDIIITYNPE